MGQELLLFYKQMMPPLITWMVFFFVYSALEVSKRFCFLLTTTQRIIEKEKASLTLKKENRNARKIEQTLGNGLKLSK